ncbi:MAG: peptidylprolyl isomerase [Actinomycetota bacterium]|nr:peptidylprolyl isomerase [Actinomycetota bacterium]
MRPATISHRAHARLAVPATLVALLAAGCAAVANTGDPTVAAVVNGEEIPIAVVESRFEAAKASPQVSRQLEGDDGTAARRFQAQVLSDLISSRLLEQAASTELGITVDQAAVEAKRAEVVEQVGGQEEFDRLVAQSRLTPEDLESQVRDLVYQERVAQRLTRGVQVPRSAIEEAYARTYRDDAPRVRHILVESDQQAQDVLRRLQAGEDFAALASEVSIDPGSASRGGDLGAIRRGETVRAFEQAVFAAQPGQFVGPVPTEFGYHVLQVLAPPPLDEVEDELRNQVLEQRQMQELRAWLSEQARQAHVTVNPRFGVWDPTAGQVRPTDPLGEVTEAPQAPDNTAPGAREPTEQES